MDIDWRVLVVVSPVLLAGGWAAFNIGQAAIKQVQTFLNRQA